MLFMRGQTERKFGTIMSWMGKISACNLQPDQREKLDSYHKYGASEE